MVHRTHVVCRVPFLVLVLLLVFPTSNSSSWDNATTRMSCWLPRSWSSAKRLYRIGVLAHRGKDEAFREFHTTFHSYLTATAGQRFDPPLAFEMVALNYTEIYTYSEAPTIDLIYVNPSAYSCIESERGARSLVSQISRRTVNGNVYHLKMFGGVIIARADNDEIHTKHDLKDKIIAAASISGLGSGQMQYRELLQAGMSYIHDPKQLVFTSDQTKVVHGVMRGEFDVGFIRTDQMERTKDPYVQGQFINASFFKVIDPKPNLTIDGIPFPFQSSTILYPEWNVAALEHVPDSVTIAIQEALLNMVDHGRMGRAIHNCVQRYNQTYCDALPYPEAFLQSQTQSSSSQLPLSTIRCDTTKNVAQLAFRAMSDGAYSGWTTTLSYMNVRSMQEATGLISMDPKTHTWHCIKTTELYDFITCPPHHSKKTRREVELGCRKAHLKCSPGNQCICHPCSQTMDCLDSISLFGHCVAYEILLPSILVPMAFLGIATCLLVVSQKSREMVRQAKIAAKNERDLNEYIAHEVRNPLAAAMSACNFVYSAVDHDPPWNEKKSEKKEEEEEDEKEEKEEQWIALREDVKIIDSSLRFINDLLRSMLDVHRAVSDQLELQEEVVAILHDVFEPVASMIYHRDSSSSIQFRWECFPEDLCIRTDRLRLQQIVLNLTRNAAKFVEEGFIQLNCYIVQDNNNNNNVIISVQDSGPGIPEEKRKQLFSRFQQSLDTLAQGTGVGLNLCKKLIDLMGGTIHLDETYTSGYKDYPGTRWVITMNRSPEICPLLLQEQQEQQEQRNCLTKQPCTNSSHDDEESNLTAIKTTLAEKNEDESTTDSTVPKEPSTTTTTITSRTELPKEFSVLFVDDDRILRRLASRAILRVAPGWKVREAASGETALQLVENEPPFDAIFMDQYMTSIEQPLKGTETVRKLRAKGISSLIYGLSANHMEGLFLESGADGFLLKPFPCATDELHAFLLQIVSEWDAKKNLIVSNV